MWDDLPTPGKAGEGPSGPRLAAKQVSGTELTSSWTSLFSWRGLSICNDGGDGSAAFHWDKRKPLVHPLVHPVHGNMDGHLRHISRQALELFQKECRTVTASKRVVGSVHKTAVTGTGSAKDGKWIRGKGGEGHEMATCEGQKEQQLRPVQNVAGKHATVVVEPQVEPPASRAAAAGARAVSSTEALAPWQKGGASVRGVAVGAVMRGTGIGIGLGGRREVGNAGRGITMPGATQTSDR